MKRRKTFHPHFRKSRKTHHYGYIFDEKNDRYSFVGITHSSRTHGVKNIPLYDNPNPSDSSKSYALPYVDEDNKFRFSKNPGWKVSSKNKVIFDGIIKGKTKK